MKSSRVRNRQIRKPVGIEYPKWWQFWRSPKIIYKATAKPIRPTYPEDYAKLVKKLRKS